VAKSSVKEWLLQGMFPKRTTGILYGSGGILKTKLLYQVIKAIIQGESLGEFSATGKQRKILIYQGDERESDTVAALEIMGFSRDQIGEHVKFRFNWSFEHMPLLLQDLQEYQPELVLIDSLTYANRFSSYTENEVAYARPILELTGLANEYNTSFMLIHHANRNGDIRGSSAIFNAVSEVWKIEKDNSPYATPNDRILSVEKSRSRSSGKKYKLIFEPENLGFAFTGEQETDFTKQEDSTCKTKILEFLRRHPNIHYTAEDICSNINYTRGTVNKALSWLVSDGLVQLNRGNGRTPYTYYISFEGFDPFAAPPTPPSHIEEQHRSSNGGAAYNQDTVSVSGFAAPAAPQNQENFENFENQKREKIGAAEQQTPQSVPDKESLLLLDQNQQEEQQEQQEQQKKEENMCYNPEPSKVSESQYKGILSDWNIKYIQSMKTALITIECHSEKLDVTLQEATNSQESEYAFRCAEKLIFETESGIAINSDRLFKVQQLGDDDYIYIEKCRMIMGPDFARHRYSWLFEAPNGERLRAASIEEFEVTP
jgi:AAA domain